MADLEDNFYLRQLSNPRIYFLLVLLGKLGVCITQVVVASNEQALVVTMLGIFAAFMMSVGLYGLLQRRYYALILYSVWDFVSVGLFVVLALAVNGNVTLPFTPVSIIVGVQIATTRAVQTAFRPPTILQFITIFAFQITFSVLGIIIGCLIPVPRDGSKPQDSLPTYREPVNLEYLNGPGATPTRPAGAGSGPRDDRRVSRNLYRMSMAVVARPGADSTSVLKRFTQTVVSTSRSGMQYMQNQQARFNGNVPPTPPKPVNPYKMGDESNMGGGNGNAYMGGSSGNTYMGGSSGNTYMGGNGNTNMSGGNGNTYMGGSSYMSSSSAGSLSSYASSASSNTNLLESSNSKMRGNQVGDDRPMRPPPNPYMAPNTPSPRAAPPTPDRNESRGAPSRPAPASRPPNQTSPPLLRSNTGGDNSIMSSSGRSAPPRPSPTYATSAPAPADSQSQRRPPRPEPSYPKSPSSPPSGRAPPSRPAPSYNNNGNTSMTSSSSSSSSGRQAPSRPVPSYKQAGGGGGNNPYGPGSSSSGGGGGGYI